LIPFCIQQYICTIIVTNTTAAFHRKTGRLLQGKQSFPVPGQLSHSEIFSQKKTGKMNSPDLPANTSGNSR
jgi:hypothetical protein